MANTERKLEVLDIPVDKIKPNPFQPRGMFNEETLQELAGSIQQKGVLQPIMVRKVDGGYELVQGERRLRACKFIGRETIPAFVTDTVDGQMLEIAFVENLQREDLRPMEEARALSVLGEQHEGDMEAVAIAIGKSTIFVRDRIMLLNLVEDVQKMLDNDQINLEQAKVLIDIGDAQEQVKYAKLAARLKLKANQLKGRTQKVRKKKYVESDKRRKRVVFSKFTRTMIDLFDMCEGIDVKKLTDEQRTTAVQQIENLTEALEVLKEKLSALR